MAPWAEVAGSAVAWASVAAGVTGVAVYGAILNVPAPGNTATPHWFGLWLAMFLALYGAQILWQGRVLAAYAAARSTPARCTLAHYAVLVVVAAVLVLGACVAGRLDGILWGTALAACLGVNVAVAIGNVNLRGSEVAQASLVTNAASADTAPLLLDDAPRPAAASQSPSRAMACAIGFNAAVVAFAFLCLGLVTVGTWVQAGGYRRYPPPGPLYPLSMDGGRVDVMAFCTGPFNASLPTFLFDIGGGGHSSADLYGLQFALNDLGRRVCTYDYPGCGSSGYAVGTRQPALLDQVVAALGEPGPFLVVGTMDGGAERIYEYALAHPSDVAALLPISYGLGEFPAYQAVRNLSDDDAQSYAAATLAGRRAFGNVILAMGVQWGLMGLFVGPTASFVPADRQAEKLFLNLFTDKQWTTQVNVLASQVADPTIVCAPSLWAANRTLAAHIPVIDFFNRPNMTARCIQYGYAADSVDCGYLVSEDALSLAFNEAMVSMTANSELIPCDDCEGDGAYLSGNDNLPWLVENIMRTVGNITVDRGLA